MSLSPAQLAFRRTGITATDSVVLAGESAHRSPLDVYNDKLGLSEPWEGNAATRIGEQLEPVAMQLLAEEFGLVLTQGVTERHPQIPHEMATPDRNVMVGDTRVAVAEAKVVGYRMAHRWTSTAPADSALIQVTKQMLVARVNRGYIAALFGTEPRFYEVELDERNLGPALLEMDEAFWRDHVVARVPPVPDATTASARALRQLYPRVKGGIVRASPEIEDAARAYFDAKRELDSIETKLRGAENAIKSAIGDNQSVAGDGWSASWNERRGSVSWKGAFDGLVKVVGRGVDLETFRGAPIRVFECKPQNRKGLGS